MEKNKALRMPYKFVDIEQEIEYLEGGYRPYRTAYIPALTRRISRKNYANSIDLGNLLT